MNNYSKLYWFTRLDHFSDFITAAGILFIAVSVILLLVTYAFWDKSYESQERKDEIDAGRKKAVKKSKWLIPTGFFIIFITVFIPSKNEAIFIIAGGKTLDYVQSDTSLSKIPYKTTSVIVEYLDKTLRDIKSK